MENKKRIKEYRWELQDISMVLRNSSSSAGVSTVTRVVVDLNSIVMVIEERVGCHVVMRGGVHQYLEESYDRVCSDWLGDSQLEKDMD